MQRERTQARTRREIVGSIVDVDERGKNRRGRGGLARQSSGCETWDEGLMDEAGGVLPNEAIDSLSCDASCDCEMNTLLR